MNREQTDATLTPTAACMLDVALSCIARGWCVFPCKPRDKEPLYKGAYKQGTLDEAQVRAWWTRTPDANVGIAPGMSKLTVLDVDTGLADEQALHLFVSRYNLPVTFAVRTGKRPDFRVQLYFASPEPLTSFNGWEVDTYAGDVRGTWGHVMAPGCIHPESGATYEVLWDQEIVPLPDWVRTLTPAKKERAQADPTAPITEWRNDTLIRILGKHRAAGADDEAIEYFAHHINDNRISPPLDEEELARIIKSACGWQIGEPEGVIRLDGKVINGPAMPEQPQEPVDWRKRYHTSDEMANAPEPKFIIEGFIQRDVITAIAAPVGQRKTIIAANVVHSSITSEPLFGHFKVLNRPARVLYLCPEMGLFAFSKRIRDLGLMPYVGKTLFCRTMNSEGRLSLRDLTEEELAGALVVIDTAVRFVEGDENSSEDMKVFAEDCFRLMKAGAASVIVLFHSPKGTKEASDLTLENAMRGSGDLGAFVSSCWATRLQDPDKPWESESYLKNVKQRDFESDPCTVKSDKLGRLHIVVKPGDPVTLNTKSTGPRGNADGKEEAALQVIRDNPKLTQKAIVDKLKVLGIKRGKTWVGEKRYELLQESGGVMP